MLSGSCRAEEILTDRRRELKKSCLKMANNPWKVTLDNASEMDVKESGSI